MKTKIFKPKDINDKCLDETAEILRNGGLAAIPTETVYGLAANALDGKAVSKVFAAKGRPSDNPMIVHITEFEQIYKLASSVPESAVRLAEAYWPGPLTMILPKSEAVPPEVSPNLQTVAVRNPSHPIARAIIEKAGVPLAAPSANSSGLPSPTSVQHVIDDMDGKIDAIVDGGDCDVGIESTVVTLVTDPPRILRPGGITPEQLEAVLGKVEIDPAVLASLKEGEKPASPGMKYKHYSPKAEVFIVNGSLPSFKYQLDCDLRDGDAALCFDGEEDGISVPCLTYGKRSNPEEQAHLLFARLRQFDEMGAKRVFVRSPSTDGVGLGVYNRLLRSAAFKIIDPPFIYALTGQSGAGKSSVARLLEKKGYLIIDGDVAARKAVKKGSPILDELCREFGSGILLDDGSLNRGELARLAFADEESRQTLNRITHPEIKRLTVAEIKDKYSSRHKGVAIDAAAIFESEIIHYCTKSIVVTAPREIRLERIIKRDGITAEAAERRINAQKDEQYYIDRADTVIRNYPPYDLSEELKAL